MQTPLDPGLRPLLLFVAALSSLGILGPQPKPSAVTARGPNDYTSIEFLGLFFLKCLKTLVIELIEFKIEGALLT